MSNRTTVPLQDQALGSIPQFHAVRFYKDSASLCGLVATFLIEGFRQGQPAVAITTQAHRQGIVQCLDAEKFNAQQLQQSGDLLFLDAETTLDQFMIDGRPDAARFADTLVPVLEGISRGRITTIRAYGEMVDVLWKAQQTVAATRLEMLWNDLARRHNFSLLCGYAMGNFYKGAAVDEICSHHTHVVSSDGAAVLTA